MCSSRKPSTEQQRSGKDLLGLVFVGKTLVPLRRSTLRDAVWNNFHSLQFLILFVYLSASHRSGIEPRRPGRQASLQPMNYDDKATEGRVNAKWLWAVFHPSYRWAKNMEGVVQKADEPLPITVTWSRALAFKDSPRCRCRRDIRRRRALARQAGGLLDRRCEGACLFSARKWASWQVQDAAAMLILAAKQRRNQGRHSFCPDITRRTYRQIFIAESFNFRHTEAN